MTQTVAYNTSTGALLSYTDLPDLSSFNGEGYTYSWGSIGAISGNTTIDAVKTPNEYTVTIRSEYEIDGTPQNPQIVWVEPVDTAAPLLHLLTFCAGSAIIMPTTEQQCLQGRVQFPIGGIVRERFGAGFGAIPKPTVQSG